jgi:hypothetical protein
MLPLEMVDPGGSLSMLLSPRLKGETPVREGCWQVAMAGASPSAVGGQWQWFGNSSHRTALDSQFCDFHILFLLFSLLSIIRSTLIISYS